MDYRVCTALVPTYLPTHIFYQDPSYHWAFAHAVSSNWDDFLSLSLFLTPTSIYIFLGGTSLYFPGEDMLPSISLSWYYGPLLHSITHYCNFTFFVCFVSRPSSLPYSKLHEDGDHMYFCSQNHAVLVFSAGLANNQQWQGHQELIFEAHHVPGTLSSALFEITHLIFTNSIK